jgi:hypothetical protein
MQDIVLTHVSKKELELIHAYRRLNDDWKNHVEVFISSVAKVRINPAHNIIPYSPPKQ